MTNNNLSELRNLLEKASPEDRANFEKIIDFKLGDSPELLCDRIQHLQTGIISPSLNSSSYMNSSGYKQLVTDIASHIHIDWTGLLYGRWWNDLSAAEIEAAVVIRILYISLCKMNYHDQGRLCDRLAIEASDIDMKRDVRDGNAEILGRLSSFQVYLLTTAALRALTVSLGITLPFGVYTKSNQGLSVVLGQIRFDSRAFTLSRNSKSPYTIKLTSGIVYISYIRHKLNLEL